MTTPKFSFRNLPGWVYSLAVLALLYATGLHTEAIGQVQRVILATGIIRPDLPENPVTAASGEITNAKARPESIIANDFILRELNGSQVKFSSLKNKVIFMNIWATWCPPCVAEMPSIQGLYDKVKANKNIAFVMLSADQEGIEKVRKFIAKKGYTFPVYLPASSLPETFQSQTIPVTFILDRKGKIAARHDGMPDYDTREMKEYLLGLAK